MFKVSVRSLLSHKLRLALTAIAIVLGVTFSGLGGAERASKGGCDFYGTNISSLSPDSPRFPYE